MTPSCLGVPFKEFVDHVVKLEHSTIFTHVVDRFAQEKVHLSVATDDTDFSRALQAAHDFYFVPKA